MEKPKNKLTDKQEKFLDGLREYIDLPLFYYGSVMRDDYVPGKSDIDIDIFTDNEDSTISKLQHYLNKSRKDCKKIIWNSNLSKKIINGYKIKYKSSFIKTELSIYNNKYKDYVLAGHRYKMVLPDYAYCILNFLKFLYYRCNIISKSLFIYIKNKVLTEGIGVKQDEYIIY